MYIYILVCVSVLKIHNSAHVSTTVISMYMILEMVICYILTK